MDLTCPVCKKWDADPPCGCSKESQDIAWLKQQLESERRWRKEDESELTTLRQRAEAAERRVRELEGDARLGLRYTVGTEGRTLFAMPDGDAAKTFALELSSQLGRATWIKDHEAKAAIDAAGGEG